MIRIDSKQWMTPYPRTWFGTAINRWALRHDPQRQALIAMAEREYEVALLALPHAPSDDNQKRLERAMMRMVFDA